MGGARCGSAHCVAGDGHLGVGRVEPLVLLKPRPELGDRLVERGLHGALLALDVRAQLLVLDREEVPARYK